MQYLMRPLGGAKYGIMHATRRDTALQINTLCDVHNITYLRSGTNRNVSKIVDINSDKVPIHIA